MKLTFPPKKVQFWLIFSGLSLIALLWIITISLTPLLLFSEEKVRAGYTFLEHHKILMEILRKIIIFADFLISKLKLNLIFAIIIIFVIPFILVFWLFGNIIWMIGDAIKNLRNPS